MPASGSDCKMRCRGRPEADGATIGEAQTSESTSCLHAGAPWESAAAHAERRQHVLTLPPAPGPRQLPGKAAAALTQHDRQLRGHHSEQQVREDSPAAAQAERPCDKNKTLAGRADGRHFETVAGQHGTTEQHYGPLASDLGQLAERAGGCSGASLSKTGCLEASLPQDNQQAAQLADTLPRSRKRRLVQAHAPVTEQPASGGLAVATRSSSRGRRLAQV